jgi:dipeptidyl aminopeptidase/acylaminoacyl peptidase
MTLPIDRRQVMAGFAASVVAASAHAQQKPPETPLIPRRLLFDDPARTGVQISRDGRRLAWLAPLNGVLNIFVAPIADVANARAITNLTDRRVGSFFWLHNNRHICFVREQGGDENWQMHSVDVESGKVVVLTPGPGVRSFLQQLSVDFPDELLVSHNQRDKRHFDVYRVNAVTGTSTLLETNDRFTNIFTDPQFKVRFGIRTTEDGGSEYLQRNAKGEWELFSRIGVEDALSTRAIEFSGDGKELYWLDSRGRDTAAVVAQDMASGAVRTLAEDAKADFGFLLQTPVTLRPLAASVRYARSEWRVLDPAFADDFAAIAKLSDGDALSVQPSDDLSNWLVYVERDAAPGQFFHYDRTTKQARPLFVTRPALEGAPLVPMQPVVVKARDGLDLVCYLSRPRDAAAATPTPMVLLVHGGPWLRDIWTLNTVHQWLANRGYAVLSVNYRGSTGFGKAFVNAANLEWGGKMHDDLIDAVDWAIAERIADPAKVAIYGGSYGGYAALVGATFTPEKFACAVDVFGISNLNTFINTIPDYWKPWQTVWKARMGDFTTEAGRKFLEERSPLSRVDRIARPMLIAQGANDARVKASESEQIVEAMKKRGLPVTYVYYSDEGHGFMQPANRRSFNAVLEAFLAKHLGGRAEPVGDDFAGSTIELRTGREFVELR